jgi:glycosyltransferase involved in cell wall biosynthesis
MLKVAIVIPTIDAIGGAERQVLLLAVELRQRGHEVTLIALSGNGGMEGARLVSAGVGFVTLEMRKAWIDPRGWWRYLRWARGSRPEVMHAHLPHASWFARWVRLLCPVRVVMDTIHTSNAGGPGRRFGYRLSDWLSNQLTCVSEAVAEAAQGMTLRQDLTIVPNGVVMPELKQRETRLDDGFRWVAVGRLERVKDYPTLLRAFALLARATLTIAGSGRAEAALQELAVQLQIEDRVAFAGFQAEVYGLLRGADGFVLSSLWEGLPVSVLEAQAAGLPVVATDGHGTSEAMIAGLSGLLVPIGDVAALAKAMAAVMAMPNNERTAMGAAGRAFVEQRFALPVVVEGWEKLYARLLAENPKAKRHAR